MSINTNLFAIKTVKKCASCHKKSKILTNQLVDGNIKTSAFCISCFKKELPKYTLAMKCVKCTDCFKCSLQKALFTRKEIKQFKKELDSYLIVV